MSLIPCANECVYQNDGYCNLNEIPHAAGESGKEDCSYYIPREKRRRGGGSAAEKP